MGLLDGIFGGNGDAGSDAGANSSWPDYGPWGGLYQAPKPSQAPTLDEAVALGRYGAEPFMLGTPVAPNVFPDPPKVTPDPKVDNWAPNTVPFSFAGPGSMNVTPGYLAANAPAPGPAPVAPAAAPSAAPSAAPPAVRPAAAPPKPDSYIAVGDYRMPQFGTAPQAAAATSPQPAASPPQAPGDNGPGLGDRLAAGLSSFAHSRAFLPALANGISGFATGMRADPDGASNNLTIRALQARGISPTDAAAAAGNPAIMRSLIGRAYGDNNGDGSGQGAAASAPLAMPTRPRLQQPPVRGVMQGGIRWRRRLDHGAGDEGGR